MRASSPIATSCLRHSLWLPRPQARCRRRPKRRCDAADDEVRPRHWNRRPAPQLTATDLEAWLDGFMPFALERGDIAGAVVVVVKDGQVLLQKGYGYADVDKRSRSIRTQTLFRPGSVSKLFTWTAVMQLVERGKLDLDADVNTVPRLQDPAGPTASRSRCATS